MNNNIRTVYCCRTADIFLLNTQKKPPARPELSQAATMNKHHRYYSGQKEFCQMAENIKSNIVYSSRDEWLADGERRFGKNLEDWKFICPHCGNIASGKEFRDAGADPSSIYCECIGRYIPNKGCDWAAYGLLDICTTHVENMPVFDFANGGESDES